MPDVAVSRTVQIAKLALAQYIFGIAPSLGVEALLQKFHRFFVIPLDQSVFTKVKICLA